MKAKPDKNNPDMIDFKDWNLDAVEEPLEAIKKRIVEGVNEVIALATTYDIVLTPYWEDDAEFRIDVRLPFGETDGSDQPAWNASMRDFLGSAVEGANYWDEDHAKDHPGELKAATNSMRDLLRDILKRLDANVPDPNQAA